MTYVHCFKKAVVKCHWEPICGYLSGICHIYTSGDYLYLKSFPLAEIVSLQSIPQNAYFCVIYAENMFGVTIGVTIGVTHVCFKSLIQIPISG